MNFFVYCLKLYSFFVTVKICFEILLETAESESKLFQLISYLVCCTILNQVLRFFCPTMLLVAAEGAAC